MGGLAVGAFPSGVRTLLAGFVALCLVAMVVGVALFMLAAARTDRHLD